MAQSGQKVKAAIKAVLGRASGVPDVRRLATETNEAFWATYPAIGDLQHISEELRERSDDLQHRSSVLEVQVDKLTSGQSPEARWIHDFGKAVSRERGAEGAPDAYRELSYLVQELRREVRDLKALLEDRAASGDGTPGSEVSQAEGARNHDLFDYVGFERRFRGDPEVLEPALVERWREDLVGAGGLIVDIGCGRGELIGALAGEGAEVLGVEPNAELARQTRARGVECAEVLADEYLKGVDDGSIGAIVMLHVAEHLPVEVLIEVLELSARKLKPGGLFVAETPNPTTFITMHESYILDPTHVQPLHPALFSFLAERAGFSEIEVRYFSPATTQWFEPLEEGEAPEVVVKRYNVMAERLNHQLYGPQDFAIVARTPTPN